MAESVNPFISYDPMPLAEFAPRYQQLLVEYIARPIDDSEQRDGPECFLGQIKP